MALVHSYGPSCALHEDFNEFTRRASGLFDEAPKIKAHFFYRSALPIDDPLSPVPNPSTGHQLGQSQFHSPHPFSAYDNASLEKAWRELQGHDCQEHRGKMHGHGPFCTDTGIAIRSHGPDCHDEVHTVIQDKSRKGKKHGHGPYCHDGNLGGKQAETRDGKRQSFGTVHTDGKQSGTDDDTKKKVHGHGPYCTDAVNKVKEEKLKSSRDGSSLSCLSIARESSTDQSRTGVDNLAPIMKDATQHGLFSAVNGKPKASPSEIEFQSILGTSMAPKEVDFADPQHIANLRKADTSSPVLRRGKECEDPTTRPTECDDAEHDPSSSSAMLIGSARSIDDSDAHVLFCDDPQHVAYDESVPLIDELGASDIGDEPEKRNRNIFSRKSNRKQDNDLVPTKPSRSPSRHKYKTVSSSYGSSPAERNTTGTPFLRAPSPARAGMSAQRDGAASEDEALGLNPARPYTRMSHSGNPESNKSDANSKLRSKLHFAIGGHKRMACVPVGLSRLHLVEMPVLEMKPIYWSPLHDISSVIRGTWFYKETMLPVESDVANHLEEGYEYMKPWTNTYSDEVNSCLEIGPEAELKIAYRLWPSEEPEDTKSGSIAGEDNIEAQKNKSEQLTAEERARHCVAAAAGCAENRAFGTLDDKEKQAKQERVRLYGKSSVIYANTREAQILRANMLPSVARGRKPLGPIRKGRIIGIPVVRGFDYKAWDKLYPPKKGSLGKKAQVAAIASQSGVAATITQRDACPACVGAEERSKVTDLVLVIHGIGQKLSERIESYHFTHAINSFRRQMNVELESEAVLPWLRPGLGGLMVLPVNWRTTFTFENGGGKPDTPPEQVQTGPKEFTLKDITAQTIPAVRNLISDVMFDIPYYLSHHKPKMIEAVIKEANRIYRLWCRNNPGFQESGRVHLIAHSLGSVMALDILSKQPTRVPKHLSLTSKRIHKNIFEFDTTNLFFCGSPAGFFLLLNNAPLMPRKGCTKPESDGDNLSPGVAGDVGTYGCLAVDNIYNVMHYNDPIAYRVNACVDVDYADSLQPASVPSTSSTWLQTIGSVFRGGKPTGTAHGVNPEAFPTRPTIGKLPSTIEMEIHNFTLEEIAEKKMYLLNENGQIDYFLSSGGGPLEIQYFNMLSAHSSYWTLQDFIRFLVVEIGRKPGRSETVVGMRAVKKVPGKK